MNITAITTQAPRFGMASWKNTPGKKKPEGSSTVQHEGKTAYLDDQHPNAHPSGDQTRFKELFTKVSDSTRTSATTLDADRRALADFRRDVVTNAKDLP